MKNAKKISNSTPIIGLLLLIITYYIVMGGEVSAYNVKIIVNQAVIIAIVATGAIFIFSTGSFDISLGASTAVSAMVGALVLNKTGSILLMLVACVLTGVLIGGFNSILAAVFNLPAFVTTIAMLSVLNSIVELILGGITQLKVNPNLVAPYDNLIVKIGFALSFYLICWFIQKFTKVGRRNMFVGESSISAKQSGISAKKQTIIAFTLAGVGVGIGAFLTVVRAPVLGKATAGSIGMNVLMAIVFGGMPLSGGSKTKISSAIVGSCSIVLLNQILPVLRFDTGVSQAIKAVMFLIVVFVASLSYKEDLLPR